MSHSLRVDQLSSRRVFLRYSFMAIATMLTSVSCRRQAEVAQSTTSQTQPLRLGLMFWAGFMPWKVAQEKNFFQSNNANVEITWFPVLSDQLTAFNTGKIDVAGMIVSDVLTGVSQGVKAKVVSVTDVSLGADAIVVAPEIDSIEQFSGKRASVEVGTVGHLLLLKALERAGVSPNEVQIVNQAADAAIAALIAGRAEIAYSYEPFVSQAVNSGKGKVIFSSKDVPGLMPALMVVHQNVLDRQPQAVQDLLKVWYQTLDYRSSHLEEVLPIEAKQASISVEEYQNLLRGFKWLTPQEAIATFQPSETTQSLIYTAKELSDFMLKQKLLTKEPPSFAELIEDRFLQHYLTSKRAA